jgi:hypothetical protein
MATPIFAPNEGKPHLWWFSLKWREGALRLVNIPGRIIVAPPQPAANFRMRRHPEIDGAIERGVAHQIAISPQSGSRSNRPCDETLSARLH